MLRDRCGFIYQFFLIYLAKHRPRSKLMTADGSSMQVIDVGALWKRKSRTFGPLVTSNQAKSGRQQQQQQESRPKWSENSGSSGMLKQKFYTRRVLGSVSTNPTYSTYYVVQLHFPSATFPLWPTNLKKLCAKGEYQYRAAAEVFTSSVGRARGIFFVAAVGKKAGEIDREREREVQNVWTPRITRSFPSFISAKVTNVVHRQCKLNGKMLSVGSREGHRGNVTSAPNTSQTRYIFTHVPKKKKLMLAVAFLAAAATTRLPFIIV